MPFLTADQIIAASDMKYVDIDVPEWGGTIRVRVMSGTDRNSFEREWNEASATAKAEGGRHIPMFRERMIARCACGADLKRLFSDEQVAELAEKNALVLDRVAKACLEINGFTKDAGEALAKN